MRKIVIIPDSFKGTLSSKDACGIMSDAARNIFPNAEIIAIPIADGGEGTVGADLEASYHAGIVAAFSINRKPMPLEEATAIPAKFWPAQRKASFVFGKPHIGNPHIGIGHFIRIELSERME